MASSARLDELRKKFDENPRRYFAPLANEYRKTGDLDQAIFICQKYLPQQPGHMSGHIVYGQTLFELARHDEARTVFETALSLDPENLIALRHLGDISRLAGDSASARTWYKRVLEADPRNEEIAQVLMLLATPEGSRAAITSSDLTPASSLAVDFSELEEPEASPAELSRDSLLIETEEGFRVETSQDHSDLSDLTVGPELSALHERQESSAIPQTPAWTTDPLNLEPDELMEMHDFTVGGVQLSSIGMSGAVESPPAEPFPDTSSGNESAAESDSPEFTESFDAFVSARTPDASADLVRGEGSRPDQGDVAPDTGDGSFELDSLAIAAGSGEREEAELPREELAADIALGLPDDGTDPALADPRDVAVGDVAGLETYESGVMRQVIDTPTPLDVEPFFDDGVSVPSSAEDAFATEPVADVPVAAELESAPVGTPNDGHAVPAADGVDHVERQPAEAFVTETMAELYLQQGHVESAREIYQQLVKQRPGELQLQDRLRAIEGLLHGTSMAAETELVQATSMVADDVFVADEAFVADEVFVAGEVFLVSDAPVQAGPTIREFLVGLMGARISGAFADDDFSSGHGGGGIAEAGEVAAPTTARGTPLSSETISGSIDALFTGADASSSDTTAATNLAQAFASEEPAAAALEGVPAHRAPNELSLDHVFKTAHIPRPDSGSGSFSFDQFFADDVGETPGKPATEPPAPAADGGDDVAQFNTWLSGLKKT